MNTFFEFNSYMLLFYNVLFELLWLKLVLNSIERVIGDWKIFLDSYLTPFLCQLCCSATFKYFCNSLVQIEFYFLFLEAIFYAWFETRVTVFQISSTML